MAWFPKTWCPKTENELEFRGGNLGFGDDLTLNRIIRPLSYESLTRGKL